MNTSLWTLKTSACHLRCPPVRDCWRQLKPSTAHHRTIDQETVRAGSRTGCMSFSGRRCGLVVAKGKRKEIVVRHGPAAGPKVEAVPPLAPIQDPQNPLVLTQGPDPDLALDHVPTLDRSPGAGAVPALLEAAPGPDLDRNPTPLEGGAGLDLAAKHPPLQLDWVLVLELLSLNQDLVRRIRDTRC